MFALTQNFTVILREQRDECFVHDASVLLLKNASRNRDHKRQTTAQLNGVVQDLRERLDGLLARTFKQQPDRMFRRKQAKLKLRRARNETFDAGGRDEA